MSSATESNFKASIRAAVRGLWSGVFTYSDFYAQMDSAIRNLLPHAFHDGARECGIKPEELTDEEKITIDRFVFDQLRYIDGFATDIEKKSKANGGKLTPLLSRVDIWVTRYAELRNMGKSMACANQKMEWVLGPTKDHCKSCQRLAGKVKRASQWQAHVLPQSHDLECGGWRCQCELQPTDKPMSRGPLPAP